MRPLNEKESNNNNNTNTNNKDPNANRVWRVLPSYESVTQQTPEGVPTKDRVTGRTFFTFDKVFGELSSTTDVYNGTAKSIVSSIMSGLNGTIFAYGQTSSGKTFTMQGADLNNYSTDCPGIVHLAGRDIFNKISSTDREFLIRVSFIEIYNEEVRDLLVEGPKVKVDSSKTNFNMGCNKKSGAAEEQPHGAVIQVREDPKKGVYVEAKENIVTDFESLMDTLVTGEKSRSVGSTGMNEVSERSIKTTFFFF